MSAILDIIIVAIIALSVFFGAKNGFVKTVISFGGVVIALVIALIFAPRLQATLLETSVANSIRESVSDRLAETVSSTNEAFDPNEVKEQSEFKKILDAVGIDSVDFERKWNTWKDESVDVIRENMVEYVSTPLVKAAVLLVAFLILFFGSLIVIKIAGVVLDKIFALPVLKQANKILGVIMGSVLALVRVCLFCGLVNLVLPYFRANGFELISRIDSSKTILFNWFEKIDIIGWLF